MLCDIMLKVAGQVDRDREEISYTHFVVFFFFVTKGQPTNMP